MINFGPDFIKPIKFIRSRNSSANGNLLLSIIQAVRFNQNKLSYLRIFFYSYQTCDTQDGLPCHLVNVQQQNGGEQTDMQLIFNSRMKPNRFDKSRDSLIFTKW